MKVIIQFAVSKENFDIKIGVTDTSWKPCECAVLYGLYSLFLSDKRNPKVTETLTSNSNQASDETPAYLIDHPSVNNSVKSPKSYSSARDSHMKFDRKEEKESEKDDKKQNCK